MGAGAEAVGVGTRGAATRFVLLLTSFLAACAGESIEPGSQPGADERCYLIRHEHEYAVLVRDEVGAYVLERTTLGSTATLTFTEELQELTVARPTEGNGHFALKVGLAPNGLAAGAQAVDCLNHPHQFVCTLTSPVEAEIVTCDEAAIFVASAAGCYEERGGGYRVVLTGAPSRYQASVSSAGSRAMPWTVTESNLVFPSSLSVTSFTGNESLAFTVGSTGRLHALATATPFSPTYRRFVPCAR